MGAAYSDVSSDGISEKKLHSFFFAVDAKAKPSATPRAAPIEMPMARFFKVVPMATPKQMPREMPIAK